LRVWATRILRDHLVRGYTLNQKRLQEQGLEEIQEALSHLTRTLTQQGLVIEEGQAVLDLIERYAYSWRLLFEYDEERLARAHLRVIVKRILRKHGYPPDKQEKATQTVLQQAEVLSQEWAVA